MFQRQQPPNSADRLYINAAEFRLCINTAGVLGGQLPFVLHIHGDLARLQLVEVASVGFPTAQLGYAASRGSTGRQIVSAIVAVFVIGFGSEHHSRDGRLKY